MKKAPIFEQIVQDYLKEISIINFNEIENILDVRSEGKELVIPLLHRPYHISAQNILDPSGKKPSHLDSVLLAKYVILCPSDIPTDDHWVNYRDFMDSGPFVEGFLNTVENKIAKTWAGHADSLKKASIAIGGYDPKHELSYDLVMKFEMLPRVPLLLLFNDKDDDFPAQCKVLFEKRAERFLDMECLAMLGMVLVRFLNEV